MRLVCVFMCVSKFISFFEDNTGEAILREKPILWSSIADAINQNFNLFRRRLVHDIAPIPFGRNNEIFDKFISAICVNETSWSRFSTAQMNLRRSFDVNLTDCICTKLHVLAIDTIVRHINLLRNMVQANPLKLETISSDPSSPLCFYVKKFLMPMDSTKASTELETVEKGMNGFMMKLKNLLKKRQEKPISTESDSSDEEIVKKRNVRKKIYLFGAPLISYN